MESNTCPQNCEGFPYFPPPWISPNSISSNDNSTPWWAISRWVIIGIVIVVVVAAVYYSFRSYSRHGHEGTTTASPRLKVTIGRPDVTTQGRKGDGETPEDTTDKLQPSATTEASTKTGESTMSDKSTSKTTRMSDNPLENIIDIVEHFMNPL